MNLPRNGSRQWVIVILTAVLAVGIGYAGWCGTSLMNHERRISTVEADAHRFAAEVHRLEERDAAIQNEVASMAQDIRDLRTYFLGPPKR